MDVSEAVEVAVHRGISDARREGMNPARRALEIGAYVSLATWPYQVDGAELIGFIRNTDPDGSAGADVLAAAIVDRFKLEEN